MGAENKVWIRLDWNVVEWTQFFISKFKKNIKTFHYKCSMAVFSGGSFWIMIHSAGKTMTLSLSLVVLDCFFIASLQLTQFLIFSCSTSTLCWSNSLNSVTLRIEKHDQICLTFLIHKYVPLVSWSTRFKFCWENVVNTKSSNSMIQWYVCGLKKWRKRPYCHLPLDCTEKIYEKCLLPLNWISLPAADTARNIITFLTTLRIL